MQSLRNKRGVIFTRSEAERARVRRDRRDAKRVTQGKAPLVRALRIAPRSLWPLLLKEGKMMFFQGRTQLELPLQTASGSLQGVYQHPNGFFYTLRLNQKKSMDNGFWLHKIVFEKNGSIHEEKQGGSFAAGKDTSHMFMTRDIRGSGLGVKAASLAERDARVRSSGSHEIITVAFRRLYEKLGYTVTSQDGKRIVLQRTGTLSPKNDLSRFHALEAIDPKTGKTKVFRFPQQTP